MDNQNLCQYCNKQYSTKGNATKHEKLCRKNPKNPLYVNKDMTKNEKKLFSLIKQQKKEIELLKSKLNQSNKKEIINKSINTTNTSNSNNKNNCNNTNNSNHVTIINNGQFSKNIIADLKPINFGGMKEHFENDFSNKYIDKGMNGLANFICDVPCKDRFITTDFGRQTILFKISNDQAVSDPKANMLLNNTIKQNADTIIEKAEDRYQYYIAQIQEARDDDIEPDRLDVEKKNKTKELKSIVQNVKDNIAIEFPEATKVIVLKGMTNKIINNEIINNNNYIE
jgi:hypothetical protein